MSFARVARRVRVRIGAAAVPAFALASPGLSAQAPAEQAPPACEPLATRIVSFADPAADRARIAGITGDAPVRPRMIRRVSREVGRVDDPAPGCAGRRDLARPPAADGPTPFSAILTPLPALLSSSGRSAYPRDANDGAAWGGRGATIALTAGVELRWRHVTLTLAPTVAYQQNGDLRTPAVDVPDLSPFAYPWQPIDRPNRFGPSSFWTVDPGQSRLAVAFDRVELGLATENLWWGPARRYPLLMSNTAPGFPHGYVGTPRPIETPAGRIEAEVVWGRLTESEFFDADPGNDHRLFAGLVVDLEPRGVPGLFIGLARTYVAAPGGELGLLDGVLAPVRGRRRDAPVSPSAHPDLRLLSVFARWAFPAVGFEAYGEWAYQGEWPGLATILREPGHGSALTLGVQHVASVGARRRVRIAAELTALGQAGDARNTGLPPTTFYAGAGGPQGYTHRGQLLGAWPGPGADAEFIAVDLLDARGTIGIFAERVRFDDDAFYDNWAAQYQFPGHDAEMGAGLRQRLLRGPLEVRWSVAFTRRWNRGFIDHDGLDHDIASEANWTFELGAAWRPGIAP